MRCVKRGCAEGSDFRIAERPVAHGLMAAEPALQRRAEIAAGARVCIVLRVEGEAGDALWSEAEDLIEEAMGRT